MQERGCLGLSPHVSEAQWVEGSCGKKMLPSVHCFMYSPMESYCAPDPGTGPGDRTRPGLMEQTIPWDLQVSKEAGTTQDALSVDTANMAD